MLAVVCFHFSNNARLWFVPWSGTQRNSVHTAIHPHRLFVAMYSTYARSTRPCVASTPHTTSSISCLEPRISRSKTGRRRSTSLVLQSRREFGGSSISVVWAMIPTPTFRRICEAARAQGSNVSCVAVRAADLVEPSAVRAVKSSRGAVCGDTWRAAGSINVARPRPGCLGRRGGDADNGDYERQGRNAGQGDLSPVSLRSKEHAKPLSLKG